MKVQVSTEFFCSYFYHAARQSIQRFREETDSHYKYYHALASIVLSQCVLESYINYLIYERSLETKKISGKQFIDLSIRQKWIEFPRIVAQQTFDETSDDFKQFVELVDLRNKLVHFKTKEMNVTLEFQPMNDPPIVRDVLQIVLHPEVSKLVFHDILTIAERALATVDKMIIDLHKILRTDPPEFLNIEEKIKVKVLNF
jgi:hypothetical protein